jgi:hypothetical protein
MRASAAPPDPSWAALRVHSGRLFRRARRRVWMVFGVAALATLMALGMAARRPHRQTATVILRMSEDQKAPLRLSWTDRALRGYVNEVALSQTELLALIDRHHMFRGPDKFDPILAVETLRERIDVEVVQNHAIALVARDNRPRSAHVRISYQDGDPARAVVIARELGELVVAIGRRQQRELAEAAMKQAQAEAQAAHAALDRLRIQATSSPLAPLRARSSRDIPGMGDAFRVAQGRLDRAEESVVQAEQRLRGESDQEALNVELVDTVPSPAPWPVAKKLAVVAAVASLICFPLAALMVGAWDRRIYAVEDLRHLGVRSLGHLGLTKEEA